MERSRCVNIRVSRDTVHITQAYLLRLAAMSPNPEILRTVLRICPYLATVCELRLRDTFDELIGLVTSLEIAIFKRRYENIKLLLCIGSRIGLKRLRSFLIGKSSLDLRIKRLLTSFRLTLQQICLICIRSSLHKLTPEVVESLPLPRRIKAILLFKDLD